ncbi:MAG: CHAT domain-containing protein [Chloroflexi bacterium]|nr:MAG: CHAT domain-containing protein [Chloroflexota bacterium]
MNLQLIQEIVIRLLSDPAFWQAFLEDPDKALSEYPLTSTERRWFNRISDTESLLTAATQLGISADGDLEELARGARGIPANGGSKDTQAVPERVVSTGFADIDAPITPLPANQTLRVQSDYYFWLEVGAPVAGSIEETAVSLPDELPVNARLQVVLFPFPGELIPKDGADIGELELQADGEVRVINPAEQPASLTKEDPILTKRLFFPIRTPDQPGAYHLRCNIYYNQVLLQSRLITAHVSAQPTSLEKALISQTDYILSHTLSPAQIAQLGNNRLNIMLNDNGNGTHGFRFFGEQAFKHDAALGEGELQDLITKARGALRMAAWGDDQPYNKQKSYRYAGNISLKQLREDLIRMARRGYRFYDALINQLAGGVMAARQLEFMMLSSGSVEIATKQHARLVVPAAMFYDYPLDTSLKAADYQLCDAFVAALSAAEPLEQTDCFQGKCPHYDEDDVVCPSGFWGYRHQLGLPLSVAGAPDATAEIPVTDTLEMTVTVSLDPAFKERPKHEQRLQKLHPKLKWLYADSRDEALNLLRQSHPHIVYFYCHGGVANGIPYLHVGPPNERGITRDNLRAKRIFWYPAPRPLVFINGCHTTALEPESAIDLVSGFIETSFAAGVIGTEITIFEPLAVSFAEAFMYRFLVERQSVGEAIRGARLQLLKEKNPLGLVYIPFALTALHLSR